MSSKIAERIEREIAGLSFIQVLSHFGVQVNTQSHQQQHEKEGGGEVILTKAMRRALVKFHPDRNRHGTLRDEIEAEEKFKLLQRAYQRRRQQ